MITMQPDFICTKCGRKDDDAEPENCGYGNCFVAAARKAVGQKHK